MTLRSAVAVARSLALGVLLMAAAAAILLYSDLGSRHRRPAADAARDDAPRRLNVALVQHASIPPLDDTLTGVVQALAARGYADGARIALRRYNAEGDVSTANAIAKEVTSADNDLIISISTVTLQTVANANRFATPPRRHVFGATSDPYGAGVGVNRENHADHPPYMTGIGSLPPIDEAFRMAKQLYPALKRVGLVWNPTEANSVAATTIARATCAALGLTLVEANAENASSAGEAVASVLSRGVDVLWISPDVTVQTAVDVIIGAATRARVPVFTSLPGNADKGALFDLGANYIAIGEVQGQLAADVLDGKSPAAIPVENVMPVRLSLNQQALSGLAARWRIPADLLERADVLIDASGSRHEKPVAPTAARPRS